MLLIHAPQKSRRLDYICDLMIGELLGIPCKITTDLNQFAVYEGPKFCYGTDKKGTDLFLKADDLLFEHKLVPCQPSFRNVDGNPVIFAHEDAGSFLPYDPLAAGFFMVTRYEEYESAERDRFGRFPATASVSYRNGFLEIPVVQLWAKQLGNALLLHFPVLRITEPAYSFIPTIDMDHAFAFRCRPLYRTLGGIGRSLIHGNVRAIFRRLKVLAHLEKDPFDVYEYIRQIHKDAGVKPKYFILFADYGGNDNNVMITCQAFRDIIRFLDKDRQVGIHPSLSSGKHPWRMDSECHGLGRVLGRKVKTSRQHFLRISFPRTYRQLLKIGITEDYSMGFASHPGFRAGIAYPFWYFDLYRNDITGLKIYPVALMDVTFNDYLRLSKVDSLKKISALIQTVRGVNGTLVTLWHNESLSDYGHWEGWRPVYNELLSLATNAKV